MCLFPSEAVDKTTPTVQPSPAAKTFSKSAAAPRNGNVVPPSTFKSPAAQNKPSFQLPGRVTYTTKKSPLTSVITVPQMLAVLPLLGM